MFEARCDQLGRVAKAVATPAGRVDGYVLTAGELELVIEALMDSITTAQRGPATFALIARLLEVRDAGH